MSCDGVHTPAMAAGNFQDDKAVREGAAAAAAAAARDAADDAGDGEPDALSGLPDDVLLDILGRLAAAGDVRTVARTSVLSRRWRPLPWHHITTVSLDVGDFFADSAEWVPARRQSRRRFGDQHRATAGLAGALVRFLAAPASERVIETLALKFVLTRCDYVRRIGDLVCWNHSLALLNSNIVGAAAAAGKVKAVELELVTEVQCVSRGEAATMLGYGGRFRDFLADCPGAFRRLTSLTLDNLWSAGAAVLEELVRGCAALEFLCLNFCGFVHLDAGQDVDDAPPAVVTIDAPRSRLKTLLFVQCCVERVKLVQAPALEWFQYAWWLFDFHGLPPVRFGSTPSLRRLALFHGLEDGAKRWKLSELLANAGQLERLTLGFIGMGQWQIWVQPEHPKELGAALGGLKELKLLDMSPDCDLSWALFLLEAAPLLERIDLHVFNHICRAEWRKKHGENMNLARRPSPGFVHHSLKKLTFHRAFHVCKDVPFARLLMEVAVNLETLTMGVEDLVCQACEAAELKFPDLARSRSRFAAGTVSTSMRSWRR
ncbi:hypothetical protein ACP4OV_001104 [Aristida adscensionis]